MKIFDCFTFFNELDLLEIRLNQLWEKVDYFVLVEGDRTYAGISKDSYYLKNIERYAWASSKIIHVIARLEAEPETRWENEQRQRNAIMEGLDFAKPDDVIAISCVDEIYNDKLLNSMRSNSIELPVHVELDLYYYYINGRCTGSASIFPCPVVTKRSKLGESVHTYWENRYTYPFYTNGGWHFSFLGGSNDICEKLEAYSHQEYDSDYYKNKQRIEYLIENGKDIFDRKGVTDIEYVLVDSSFPDFIRKNVDRYNHLINPALSSPKQKLIFDQYSRYKAAEELLRQIGFNSGDELLDVGSGPECHFGSFLPDSRMTFIDPLISRNLGANYIRGNIFNSELNSRSFDGVTAVDVLEHVPPESRKNFINRISELSNKYLILGFPANDDGVAEAADKYIEDNYLKIYGKNYSWLEEHQKYGLPSLSDTVKQLTQLGWHCKTIGHGHAPWLQEYLSLVVCALEVPDFLPIIMNSSEKFNRYLYQHDFAYPHYRYFVVASRTSLQEIVLPNNLAAFNDGDSIFHDILKQLRDEYFELSLRLINNPLKLKSNESLLFQKKAIEVERNDLVSQRNLAVFEREEAERSLNLMRNSLSWRFTKPMRTAGKILRYLTKKNFKQILLVDLRRAYHLIPLPLRMKKFISIIFHDVLKKHFKSLWRKYKSNKKFHPPLISPVRNVTNYPDYIVWGVIDWDFRHQRPQQISIELANAERRIFYISPNFIDDEIPGFEVEVKDKNNLIFQIKLHVSGFQNIYTSAPTAKTISQLRLSIGEVLEWADIKYSISKIDHPFWTEAASILPNSRFLYDCMDHHEGFGNFPEELKLLEKSLFSNSEITIVTSSWLENLIAPFVNRSLLIRNAVDYDFFSTVPTDIYKDPHGRKIIGYYGAIAEWFDIDLVESIAQEYPHCCILLIGADTVDASSKLCKLKNVVFTGEVSYECIPYYLHSFDVCLLPFKVIPLTLATNPVKVYEYISAGKPVVAVNLPEMSQFEGLVYTAVNKDEFIAAVGKVLINNESIEVIQLREDFAKSQTWRHRVTNLIEQVESVAFDPLVSVVVVTYNNIEFTKACLESIDEQSQYENIEVIVVDNASSDGTQQFLSEWVLIKNNRKIILNDENRGFAAANNQGLEIAAGEYLVLLNNDTYVTPGWIRTLVCHLKRNPNIGLIGPVTNNIGNEAKIEIAYSDMNEMITNSARYTRSHIGQTIPLSTAAFFCVMIPRKVFEVIGNLDEDFGKGFFEDDDYCRRIEQIGLNISCAEDVFIHHHLSASFDKLRVEDKNKLFLENKEKYENKWGAWTPHTHRRLKTQTLPSPFEKSHYFKGKCNVCGCNTRFFYTVSSLWRESLNCEHCLSTSRYRSIARGILLAINERSGLKSDSLAELPFSTSLKRLRVYDTQPPFYYAPCAYPLPDLLAKTGWIDLQLSQYKPNLPYGEKISDSITNQNLECLTFIDSYIDIVITSDVMEHVRLDYLAHKEIYRVLKPGGIYVFTVPHNRNWSETLTRVKVCDPDDATKDINLLEPEYHGDTNSDAGTGVLSYRVYGRDLETYLQELGFEVEYTCVDYKELGIRNTELFYCRKI